MMKLKKKWMRSMSWNKMKLRAPEMLEEWALDLIYADDVVLLSYNQNVFYKQAYIVALLKKTDNNKNKR